MILLWVACEGGAPERTVSTPHERSASSELSATSRESDVWADVTASGDPVACVSAPLSCGSVIEDWTTGGNSAWSNDFYRTLFCHPIHHDWDGPERVHRLVLPKSTVATVTLDTRDDLDLFALSWPHDDCPTLEMSVSSCDADVGLAGGELTLVTQSRDQTFLVAVDGKGSVEGPYRLSVACQAR